MPSPDWVKIGTFFVEYAINGFYAAVGALVIFIANHQVQKRIQKRKERSVERMIFNLQKQQKEEILQMMEQLRFDEERLQKLRKEEVFQLMEQLRFERERLELNRKLLAGINDPEAIEHQIKINALLNKHSRPRMSAREMRAITIRKRRIFWISILIIIVSISAWVLILFAWQMEFVPKSVAYLVLGMGATGIALTALNMMEKSYRFYIE